MLPGGNTSKGFFSYYDYIIEKDVNKIFVTKSGPGTGKFSFMIRVAKVMLERGYDVEFHHCSSDNNSIEGIVVSALNVLIIDRNSSHAGVS